MLELASNTDASAFKSPTPMNPYRLRAPRLSSPTAAALAPLGLATVWFATDISLDRLSWGTWIFCGLAASAGLVGLLYVLLPVELVANDQGLSWRQFGFRKAMPWSDIEDIGVGRSKAFDGYDRPMVSAITGGASLVAGRQSLIGVNLRTKPGNAATVAYRRGLTGFELNFANVFDVSSEVIVAELNRRLALWRS